MHFFYLRPPVSQCFAFYVTVLLFATLYPMASKPRITHATGLGFNTKEDHNDLRTLHLSPLADKIKSSSLAQGEKKQNYEPDFAGFDRSIIGRVPGDSEDLDNNVPMKRNISQGQTQYWVFRKNVSPGPTSTATREPLPFESAPREVLDHDISGGIPDHLKKQDGPQKTRMLYTSLTICKQPSLKDQSLSKEAQPLLTVYISLSSDNQHPGHERSDLSFETVQGHGATRIPASGDLFFSVTAATNSNFDGDYNYELTASIDALYAAYNSFPRPPLLPPSPKSDDYFQLVDSDSFSALFVSSNLTTDTPPYSIFVYKTDDPKVLGIQRSFCGLQNQVQIKGNLLNGPSTSNVDTRLAGRDQDPRRQQFYVTGLNPSTEYFAIMAVDGNSTNDGGSVVRGGGTVGTPIPFRTKSDQNCAIIYNLSFCTDVAYAVPYNPNPTLPQLSNLTNLGALYDNNARDLYQNFSFALQQIPCNTTPAAQYSLARNCTDCELAYKSWLCAVTIPRCEDFSSSDFWLQARAVSQPLHSGRPPLPSADPALSTENKSISYMNSSRNQLIDDQILPGPWKEILPCKVLCYQLVQSCPSSMKFVCPLKDQNLKNYDDTWHDMNVTCNYPGKPWYVNHAPDTAADKVWISIVLGVVFLVHFAS